MQLVAYGAQDIYLTGNPQITFFKVVYRRHTNFSMETIEQTINGANTVSASPTTGTVIISRNGDLVSKVYVSSSTVGVHEGSALVNEVELEIGGQRIDKHTQEWNNVWNELSIPDSKATGFATMTCARPHLEVGGGGPGMVQIPLNFWFCRNPGLALPLIALQYHEVKLKFTWGTSGDDSVGAAAVCKVWCDYIYLDTDERRRFAQVSHEYLIEQIQIQSARAATTNTLNFNHPVKELIWTSDHTNPYLNAKLVLNGHDRFSVQDEEYFQLRQPFEYHTAIPEQNNGLASFAGATVNTAGHVGALCIADVSQGISGGDVQLTSQEWNAVTVNGKIGGGKGITIKGGGGAVAVAGATATNTIAILGTAAGHAFGTGTLAAGQHHQIKIYKSGTTVPATNVKCKVVAIYKDKGKGADVKTDGTGPLKKAKGNITSLTAATSLHANVGANTMFVEYLPVSGGTTAIPASIADGDALVINYDLNGGHARTSIMSNHINVYSFALKPEEHQPSGTCNFSRIDNAQLITGDVLEITDNIYAVNYNVLRIMSGMGGLAYSN